MAGIKAQKPGILWPPSVKKKEVNIIIVMLNVDKYFFNS